MKKERINYIKGCEVSEIVKVNLGGYEQKIAIEGKKRNLPVMIVLHGGPGSPVPFSVGSRGMYPDYTDKAIMVYWDQLGSGANNHFLSEDMRISDYSEMACQLVDYIKGRFPENLLVVFGTSWGSILASDVAIKRADKVDFALSWGQIVKELIFNNEVKEALKNIPARKKKELDKIFAEGKNAEKLALNVRKVMKFVDKYTDGRTSHKEETIDIGQIVRGLLSSPDFTLRDFKAIIKNGFHNNRSLWLDLIELDLTEKLKEIKIPYIIVQGEEDLITPLSYVKEAVEACDNKNVTLKVIKNTGHIPTKAGFEAIYAELFKLGYGGQ